METENSNALSPQRYSEDSDLLERSTRKRKVGDGTSGEAQQNPVDATGMGQSSLGDVAVVEETPLSDHPASAMQIEGDGTPMTVTDNSSSSGAAAQTPAGVALPRSYLDSVDSCPTVRAEDEVEDMGDGEGLADPMAANPHTANPGVRSALAESVNRRPKPYGSWMIVTRKDRRQAGRPPGPGHQGDTGGRTTFAGGANQASGSRYAPLDDEVNAGDHQAAEQPGRRADKQPAVSGSVAARQTTRSRRPNVIANEQQINNDRPNGRNSHPTATAQMPRRQATGSGPRRAAEEDEHVVIRGEQGGQVINSTRVVNGDAPDPTTVVPTATTPEHHTDPPDDFDVEGDVVMEIENQEEENHAEGGAATDSV
nr:uncharacterized protein LOC109156749 [Ipomoea batatas]